MTVGDYTMFTPAQYYRLRERLGDAEQKNARLRELNSDVIKRLNNILDRVELSPPIEDDVNDLIEMLERGEGKDG